MNYTEHKITLDIHKTVSQVSLTVKKGDTGRRLLIHLAERGYPYHISEDCYAVFTARKPDGKVVFNDCSIDDCVIIYEFTKQTVAAVGMADCEIILYGGNGKQLTSASFNIVVEDTIYDTETEIESTDEYNALADLIAEVKALKDSIGNLSTGSAVKLTSIELLASKWVGNESPYSQVVSIPGVTANSQVDLTPSVEQMAIFYDKDITFITENDSGVVTVYVIGQKPRRDYTIQANIVEVKV